MSDGFDMYDDPKVQQFLEHARIHMVPRLQSSSVSAALVSGDPDDLGDAKMAIEIGYILLLGKPLVIVCSEDQVLPAGLERAADKVVRGEVGSPELTQALGAAVAELAK